MWNLEANLMDLLIAGTETPSTAINWSVLFMVRYPDIQDKVYQEISNVIGSDCLPSINDRTHLPYVEAVLQEVLRHSVIVPFAAPRYAVRDVRIGQFLIPQGLG